jgi:cytochrome c peroxidase
MKHLMTIALSGLMWSGCIDLDILDGKSSGATDATDPTDATDASEPATLEGVMARYSDSGVRLPNNIPIPDATGFFTTVSSEGFIDLGNEFFQDLGTNGRRCVSCHLPTAGWTVTPAQLRVVFEATRGGALNDGLGLGAVFRTNDGSNSPSADVSTLSKRRAAYSMLLTRGVIRVGLPIPANAEFELVAVDDPYHFASAKELSLFRRPLPTTNLKFDSTVMWDGRQTVPGATIAADLVTQASDATTGHAQGRPLTTAQRESIVRFETSLATAQMHDNQAKDLRAAGAQGGPSAIHAQEYYIGINDNFGDSRTSAPFTPIVFTVFDAWAQATGSAADARRAVARGQALFNTKPISIAGVSGINDEAVFGSPAVIVGTCTTCHDSPNGGNHSVVAPLDLGLADASRRTPDMPLYTLRNKATGELRQVTDPGRALISGKWAHIGRFKGPMLRDLAARAPYFHNGIAADLAEAIEFYDTRFQIGLTAGEKSDLVAFLRSL